MQVRHGQLRLFEKPAGGAEHQIGGIRRDGGVCAGQGQAGAAVRQDQGVVQAHGLHDGGYVVVAVGTTVADGQGEIHFRGGVQGQWFHGSS